MSTPNDEPGADPALGDGLSSLFVRGDFEQLDMLPIEQARAKASALGHTGQVVVKPLETFRDGCADGIVCTTSDEGGNSSGMSNSDTLVLWVNPRLSIAPPPD